jgi:prevent-host-death family protein
MYNALSSIGAFEAKTHFSQILDDVQTGREFTITKHGKSVAKIIPFAEKDPNLGAKREALLKELAEMRKTNKPVTIEEILESRHEGHRY